MQCSNVVFEHEHGAERVCESWATVGTYKSYGPEEEEDDRSGENREKKKGGKKRKRNCCITFLGNLFRRC